MNHKARLALGFLLSVAWIGIAGTRGLAAQLVPLGPEVDLLANTWPGEPFLAVQPGGAYMVAWDEEAPAVVSYHYVAAGDTPKEDWPTWIEFEDHVPIVDAVTAARQGFDVLWHEQQIVDEKPTAFYRQHLTLQGVPDGQPIRLGGPGTEWVWLVRGNGFMAGWALPRKHGIVARRLSSSGQRVGPEIRLNSRPIDRSKPFVLAVADGGFLAVWRGAVPGPTPTAVLRARRFSPAGKPLGPDFDVNTTPLGVVGTEPYVDPDFKVAAAPGGGFAVGWMLADRIYLRFFNAAGTALGPEIPAVKSKDLDLLDSPQSMAFDKAGNVLLLWSDYYHEDLRLRLFDPHGAPLGPPVGVRSEASDIFDAPWGGSVAWAGNSWLVAWAAAGASSYDFSTVFVRRFAQKP
ncbi:MAG TPA: hypothetical protein VH394_14015 [Thermoanaerobaculia bacterium]|jgi:hypothetical protein|nr:hypothetical protein [Thermoanaerobaculia bacterium]